MSPRVLVFQHVPHEHLGHFEKPLKEEGVEVEYLRSFEIPPEKLSWDRLGDPQGLIFLGGPMSANDEEICPFIAPELRILEQAFKRDLPILGVCLGAQLIAKALGSKVYLGEEKEIGWYPLTLTDQGQSDALFQGWPSSLAMFQWHGETFQLPSGSQRLAYSQGYPNQAFQWMAKVYGLQFHPEMTEAMVKQWLKINAGEVAGTPLPRDAQGILEDTGENLPFLRELAEITAKNWAQLLPLP